MTHITPLAIAALALASEGPAHPYEMYQTLVRRSVDQIVKVRPGSLYHTVERLEADGLLEVVGTEREGNRPERTTYRITEQGRLALAERVADMLATPAEEFPEFPVAVSEAHNLSRTAVIDLLESRRVRLRSRLDLLEAGVADVTTKSLPERYWLDLTYLIAIARAEVDWVDALLDDLRARRIDWGEKVRGEKARSEDPHEDLHDESNKENR